MGQVWDHIGQQHVVQGIRQSIISTAPEVDHPLITQEFKVWLIEERRLNPDHLSRDKTKKEFAVFVEDYNTATLPHEKVSRSTNER